MDAINGSMATLKGDLTTLRPLIKTLKENALNAYATESLSNQAVASFTDGAKNIPVKSLSVAITPIQSGTGDPAPDNIRPITGWSAANVTRTGENIFGGNLMRDGVLASMSSATDHPDDRYVSFAAGATAKQNLTAACGLTGKFKENTRYTFIMTVKSSGVRANLRIYYTDGTYTSIGGAVVDSKTMTLTVSAANKTVASLAKENYSGATSLYYDESGIFEGVLTAADFKPYLGNTYPISLGQTVYGGTLNVTTGVLTVDRAIVDLGTLEWTKESPTDPTRMVYRAPIEGRAYGGSTSGIYGICDSYSFAGNANLSTLTNNLGNGEFGFQGTANRVAIRNDSYTTKEAMTAALNGVYLVYPLATPTTVQLTPTEVTTLLGTNNIWADTGDVTEVTIRCDTALYIAKLVG